MNAALIFILVTVFVDLLGYGMIGPLLPFYAQRLAGGATFAGLLRAEYALFQLIFGPILGALSDRYGRRPVLLLCLLGTAGGYVLLGLADSPELLIFAIAVDSITGANLSTAQAYLADRTTPEQRTRAFGWMGAAVGLGLMAGPAFGGLLSVYGLSVPAFAAAAIAFGNVLFGLFALPESLPPDRRAARTAGFNPFARLADLLRAARLRYLLASVFLLNVVFNGLQTVFPLYSQARFEWDAYANGLFFGFLGVCAVIAQGVLVGWLQPRLGEARLVLIGLALMTGAVGGVALAVSDWHLYPIVALAALGSGLAIPSLTGVISHSVSAGEQGKVIGGLQSLISLSMIAGPALAGVAFDTVRIEVLPWLGSAATALAWLAALRAFTRRPRLAA